MKKRHAGESYPKYVTKTNIMLYLSNGKKNTIDIREHLKETLNISEKKNIDTHLQNLIDDNLIVREKGLKGLPHSYYLRDDYNGFKNIFNFFSDKIDKTVVLKLLKSQYAQDMINEKFLGNITDEIFCYMFKLFPLMLNPEKLKTQSESASLRTFLEKNSEARNLIKFISNPSKLFKIYKDNEKNYSKILKMYDEIKSDSYKIKPNIFPKALLTTLKQFIFPLHEQNEIIQILKASPSALTYMFSLTTNNNIEKLMFPLGIYFINNIENLQNNLDKIRKTKDKKEFESLSNNFLKTFQLKQKTPSPFLTILKSYYIIDITNKNINRNKWFSENFMYLFLSDETTKYMKKKDNENKKEKGVIK